MDPDHTVKSAPRGSDQRAEPRLTCRLTPATVKNLEFKLEVGGHLTNVSRSGIAIRLDRALKPGSTVSVVFGGCEIEAEVRHCCASSEGTYVAGLRIVNFLRPCPSMGYR